MTTAKSLHKKPAYPGAETLIDHLVIAGLLLGLLSMLLDSQRLAAFAFINIQNVYEQMVASPLYKLIKSVEVLCILSAGILAYWTEGRFCVNRYIKWMFAIVLLWMSGHAILTFKDGFSPAELIGQKGPAVWWSLLFLFAGYSKKRWQKIYPIVKGIVIVGALEMIFRIFSISGGFDRLIAERTLMTNLQLMLWSAPLIFLVPKKNDINKILSIFLLGLISVASLMTVTRSWMLVCLIYMVVLIYCFFKKASRPETKMMVIMGIVLVLLPVVFFVMYSLFETQIHSGGHLLASRLGSDTRTWQLEQFFRNVPSVDLLVGTGPRGTWRMGNRDYGYVDGVYFFLLFVGGVPLLIPYLYLVIYPAIRCFFVKGFSLYGSIDFACIFMVTMWGIVMSGLGIYTLPELKIYHYLVLLCAGRCWSILNEGKEIQSWSK